MASSRRTVTGILKWPRASTAPGAAAGSGGVGCNDSSSFFAPLDASSNDAAQAPAGRSTAVPHLAAFSETGAAIASQNSSASSSPTKKKHALFILPVSDPDSSSCGLETCTMYGPETQRSPLIINGRPCNCGHRNSTSKTHQDSQQLSCDNCTPPGRQPAARSSTPPSKHCSSSSFGGGDCACSPKYHSSSCCHDSSSSSPRNREHNESQLSSRTGSVLPGELSRSSYWESASCKSVSAPGGKSNRQSDIVSPRSNSSPGGGNSSSSGGGCLTSRRYGAWYLKPEQWEHVNAQEQTSTWDRQSMHLEQLEQQQHFAEQVQHLADPTTLTSTDGAATAAETEALVSIVGGLAVTDNEGQTLNLSRLSSLNPVTLMTNTWAVSAGQQGGVCNDSDKAEVEAAAAMQQYYKQLHEVAKQQAKLNAQVKGSYGLKAYKDYMQSKGYRQARSLQRIPTPTDEDMRIANLKQQREFKEQQRQQLQQLCSRRRQQQQQRGGSKAGSKQGSKRGSRVGAAYQQQQAGTGGMPSSADPMHNQQQQQQKEQDCDGSITCSGCSSSSCSSQLPAAAAAAAAVPRLDLSEVHRVTQRLHELKRACHPESGLDDYDFELLEALLTGGRSASGAAVGNMTPTAPGNAGGSKRKATSRHMCGAVSCSGCACGGSSSTLLPTSWRTPRSCTASGGGGTVSTAAAAAAAAAAALRKSGRLCLSTAASAGALKRNVEGSVCYGGSKSARAVLDSSGSTAAGGSSMCMLTQRPGSVREVSQSPLTQPAAVADAFEPQQQQQEQLPVLAGHVLQQYSSPGNSSTAVLNANAAKTGLWFGSYDAGPLRTQSTGGLGCYITGTVGGDCGTIGGSTSGRMTADAVVASSRYTCGLQQQQQQCLPLQPHRQQQQSLGGASIMSAATTAGRLSPYASSLVAPVSARLKYTLTPRSAAASATGAAASDASSGANAVPGAAARQRTAWSSRLSPGRK